MGILINPEDFTGVWDLAKSDGDNIDSYVELYEKKTLVELLGKELFDLFEADLNAQVPQDQIYLDIYEEFFRKIESVSCYEISSDGMKKMLLGIIFFYYVRDNAVKQTMSGSGIQQVEVSQVSGFSFLYQRYNDAVRTYQAIQAYIMSQPEVYPTYFGKPKQLASFI